MNKTQVIFKCNVDGRKSNSNQKWNNNKCLCECKNQRKDMCKKDFIWNLSPCTQKNGKYLGSINDDSVIRFNKIVDVIQSEPRIIIPINSKCKKWAVKLTVFIFYLNFCQLPYCYQQLSVFTITIVIQNISQNKIMFYLIILAIID